MSLLNILQAFQQGQQSFDLVIFGCELSFVGQRNGLWSVSLIMFLLPPAFYSPPPVHMYTQKAHTVQATLTRDLACKCKKGHIDNSAISASINHTSNFNVFKRNWISHWISVYLCFAV